MFDFSYSLGNTVKTARNQQGLTQNEVADMIGVDCRTILNIENFKGNPKMEILYPLVRTLRINANDIFYPESPEERPMRTKLMLLMDTCTEEEIEALIPACESILNVLRTKKPTHIK